MRLLDRYLLREFLIPLCYCLCGFLIFWIAFDLFSELHGMQAKHLLARDIAEYYLFKAPEFLILVMPIALLLAQLYTLTNHARHNEITAIRTSGVSLWRLTLPYLVVGMLATVALFALDEYCVPDTAEIANQILQRREQRHLTAEQKDQVKPLVFANSRDGRFWYVAAYNLRTTAMISPRVQWHLSDGSIRTIQAEHAVRTNGVWTFYHVSESRQKNPTDIVAKIPPVAVREYPEFSETPEMIKSEINVTEQHEHQGKTRRANISIEEIGNYVRLHPVPDPSIRAWLLTKLHGRFAGPFACIVVVLVAIPFAAASGRRNVYVGVAASLVFFFVYYVLQQLGFAFGESGRVPPWLGAWLPNLFFGIAGLWMMSRVR